MGVDEDTPADYPDIGVQVAEAVAEHRIRAGILVCGTGVGMAIVANKVPGVRVVCVLDPYLLSVPEPVIMLKLLPLAEIVGPEVAKKLMDIWLNSEFQGGRSAPKVQKIDQLDEKYRQRRNNSR